jgi:hypothetical protein
MWRCPRCSLCDYASRKPPSMYLFAGAELEQAICVRSDCKNRSTIAVEPLSFSSHVAGIAPRTI